jgi:alkanesulfonate monooxygenase SsuD/methylene tetrahydromethanopterin reductase-like flavin-dependent oxidoreductase (luciferase family)
MTEPTLGLFLIPDAEHPAATVDRAVQAESLGLDLVAVQDHPYQRRHLDAVTLLAFIAARTSRLGLVTDVANLPLRPPAVLAETVASLDVLSGGRVELGLGAGGFTDAIVSMGGPRRSGKVSVDALEEAIAVIRLVWSNQHPVSFDGEHYRIHGLKPGPPPAHPVGIWLGAYGPRMMRVTGRLADGWLPSVPRLPLEAIPARRRAATPLRHRRRPRPARDHVLI